MKIALFRWFERYCSRARVAITASLLEVGDTSYDCLKLLKFGLSAFSDFLRNRRLLSAPRERRPKGILLGPFNWEENMAASPKTATLAVPNLRTAPWEKHLMEILEVCWSNFQAVSGRRILYFSSNVKSEMTSFGIKALASEGRYLFDVFIWFLAGCSFVNRQVSVFFAEKIELTLVAPGYRLLVVLYPKIEKSCLSKVSRIVFRDGETITPW